MVLKDGAKMSKSLGNTVDPTEIIKIYGADTVRIFVLFTAPVEKDLEWSDEGIEGSNRFIKRIWKITEENISCIRDEYEFDFEDLSNKNKEFLIKINKTIDKVNYDLDRMQFNTAIASMMELLNHAYKYKEDNNADPKLFGFFVYVFIILLNPLIPHLSNELWSKSNFKEKDINKLWIKPDKNILMKDIIKVVIQINGKTRGVVEFENQDINEMIIKKRVEEIESINKYLKDKEILKSIYIENKILNLIIK